MPSAASHQTFRVGVDVGGTFTDVVLIDDSGRLSTAKVPSTPPTYEKGVIEGFESLLRDLGIDAATVGQLAHATTVATNTILERKGARTGLITTRGFRDILELRRLRLPETHNLFWEKPLPLVPRRLRVEVRERIGSDGTVVEELDIEDARNVVRKLIAEGVTAIAVCCLNSYVNNEHERAIARLIEHEGPGTPYCLSSDLLPEIKEYERTSTTVLNAYLTPTASTYLGELEASLFDLAFRGSLHVMQSSGGLVTVDLARMAPIHLIESGGAAGAVGAAHLARSLGLAEVIAFDMGGTTTKASLIQGGWPALTSEYEVGGAMSGANRLLKGGGDVVRVSAIDVAEVGAGGGSIVELDTAGRIHVGPRSAGSEPGPISYKKGGQQPTVTDANLVLGYLDPAGLLDGTFPLDLEAARRAYAEIGERLGCGVEQAAHGVIQVTNASMARTVRAISTERGRDVRESTLIVYGGSGPMHAVEMARTLGIRQVIVPPSPGVYSAIGLLYADVRREFLKTVYRPLMGLSANEVESILRRLERQASDELIGQGFHSEVITVQRKADLHYRGQWHELQVSVPDRLTDPESLMSLAQDFHEVYAVTYGYSRLHDVVDLVNLRVEARVPVGSTTLVRPPTRETSKQNLPRPAFFAGLNMVETEVLRRADLATTPQPGPLIIQEYDSTVVVPPSSCVSIDEFHNIVVTVDQ